MRDINEWIIKSCNTEIHNSYIIWFSILNWYVPANTMRAWAQPHSCVCSQREFELTTPELEVQNIRQRDRSDSSKLFHHLKINMTVLAVQSVLLKNNSWITPSLVASINKKKVLYDRWKQAEKKKCTNPNKSNESYRSNKSHIQPDRFNCSKCRNKVIFKVINVICFNQSPIVFSRLSLYNFFSSHQIKIKTLALYCSFQLFLFRTYSLDML